MLSSPEQAASPQQAIVKRVGESAMRHMKHFDRHSKLDRMNSEGIPKLSWYDLVVGPILGHGGFSEVHAASLRRRHFEPKKLDSDDEDSTTDESSCSDASVPQDYEHEYAVKFLLPAVVAKEKSFKSGAIDLVMEAKLLSLLRHENIIRLHAVSKKSITEAYLDGSHGYFLVMDRLHETVDRRIKQWQKQEIRTRSRSIFRSTLKRGGCTLSPEQKQALHHRLESVAIPVARAMKYLHEHNVIYRDLKPSNIGFGEDGTVKIFDFGLAREILHSERRLTGNTGSLRYMAPEVAKRDHYGLSADVYSFGVLLWELCALEKPFEGMTRDQFGEFVVFGGVRPTVDSAWSSHLQHLIRQCWDESPKHRPNFETVCEKLHNEVSQKSDKLSLSRHKMTSRLRNWTHKDGNSRSNALVA